MPAAMPPVNNTYNNSYETGFHGGYQTPQAPPTYRGAQVARFDTPSSPGLSKMNEDALPAMPTWEQGVSRRVEDTSPQPDSVEMDRGAIVLHRIGDMDNDSVTPVRLNLWSRHL